MKSYMNMKLQYKILIMAICPVLAMCIVAFIINNTVVKNKLLDDAKEELRATAKAVLAAYDQNTGDYFQNAVGDVWKVAYNVSLSEGFIDDIQDKTGISITFFYGDKRLVTTLVDEEGNRITGTSAGEFLVANVLQDGNDVFTNRVLVEDEFYFGYYIPVYQNNSSEIIGMIFAGMPTGEIYDSLNFITGVFSVVIVILLIITIVAGTISSRSLAKNIHDSMSVVQQISEGKLNVNIDEKLLARKDEVGELSVSTKKLVDSLSDMIGLISNSTMNLNESSQEMNAISGQASNAMETINGNLRTVMQGAEEQTGNALSIKQNISNINEHIEKTMHEVRRLHHATESMIEEEKNVNTTLGLLDSSNQSVLQEVERIRQQTMETNDSVEKIIKSVTLISDIAEETNLLSLNASIEAARAGEAGRGFAVVAEEISKLANQSNAASEEISAIVQMLSKHSNQTIEIMGNVQNAINEQSKNVTDTADIFKEVGQHIARVAKGVAVIRESAEGLEKETEEIKNDIENLSSIAEDNENTVKGAIDYSKEVLETVKSVNGMSVEVSTSANDMAEVVSNFEV